MSKDQKKTVEFTVETVEKLKEIIGWISSTILFWHLEKKWPTNIIKDYCDNILNDLNK